MAVIEPAKPIRLKPPRVIGGASWALAASDDRRLLEVFRTYKAFTLSI